MTLDPPRGGPQSRLARFIEDYNPFYLLSAACMLFGVFALNDSLDWSPLPLRKLLTLIVTLNIYEVAVIALGCFLMRRGIRRDAMLLLIVEAFFLADVGFLNMEVFATNATVGAVVNTLVLIAAVVKVAFVFSAARIPLTDGRFAFVSIQLAVLFAVAGIFGIIGQRRDNFLPPLAVYAAWWLTGALPVAYTVLVGSIDVFRKQPIDTRPGTDVVLARVLIVLPMLSLLAHLCLANWVYKVTFYPANLAPLVLGFAVVAGRSDAHIATLTSRMRLQLALPFAAIALAVFPVPESMIFPLTRGIQMSPLRMTLMVAALVHLDGLWQFRHAWFAWAAGLCALASAMGHNVGAMVDRSDRLARSGTSTLDKLIPKTLFEWGVIAIVLSFVLLALGAMISLTRRPREVILITPPEDA